MEITHNVVGWFEIPVADMDRAVKFYETVFGFRLNRHLLGPLDMAWFPAEATWMGSAGSLVCLPQQYKPSADGVLIYFTAFSGDVAIELSRVTAAGGKVLLEKRQISEEIGYMGLILDSEGNRIALHSRK
ncbi:MAG TPA: VOC family protein [Bacteroidales bacterium]|nr:VOC family protein [Bacteroidales bacterium]